MWIAGVPFTPNDTFFPLNQTWEKTFRTSGSYQAPWGIVTSSVFEYQSGTPLARSVVFRTGLRQLSTVTLRMEPLGAQELPGVKLLNLRVSKRFTVVGRNRVSVHFDCYNVLNGNTPSGESLQSRPAYVTITGILPPRVARIGACLRGDVRSSRLTSGADDDD